MNNAIIANILTAVIIVASVFGFAYSLRADQQITDLKITYIQQDITTLRNILSQISKIVVNTDNQTGHPQK